jgi:hypothetical protein
VLLAELEVVLTPFTTRFTTSSDPSRASRCER